MVSLPPSLPLFVFSPSDPSSSLRPSTKRGSRRWRRRRRRISRRRPRITSRIQGETDGRSDGRRERADPFAVGTVSRPRCSFEDTAAAAAALRDVNLTSILRKWLWANTATTSYSACHLTHTNAHRVSMEKVVYPPPCRTNVVYSRVQMC